jgi:hypothetical protein
MAPTLSTGAGTAGHILVTRDHQRHGGRRRRRALTVLAGTGNVDLHRQRRQQHRRHLELEALTVTSAAATTLFSGKIELANALTQSECGERRHHLQRHGERWAARP